MAAEDGTVARPTARPPAGDDAPTVTTFLVIVHARLTAEGVASADLPALAARVAETFIARDDAATVWIHLGTKASRITLDVPAPDRETAKAIATAIVAEVTAGMGIASEALATAATTEGERAALPDECPADDDAPAV